MKYEKYEDLTESEALAMLTSNTLKIDELPERFRDSKKVMLEAVRLYPFNIYYASDRLKDDKELALFTLSFSSMLLRSFSDSLKNDKEVALEAIKHDPIMIYELNNELKNDIDILKIVLPKKGDFLKDCSLESQKNKELVFLAIQGCVDYLNLDESMQEDFEVASFAMKYVEKKFSIYAKLPVKFQENIDFAITSLENDFNSLLYIPKSLLVNKIILETIEEIYNNPNRKQDNSISGQIMQDLLEKTYKVCMETLNVLREEDWLSENIPQNTTISKKTRKF